MKRAGTHIQVAVITGAHGIRGQVTLRCLTGDPEALFNYARVTDASGRRQFKLTRSGTKNTMLIVAVDGVTDRTQAEQLKGTALYAVTEPKKTGSPDYTGFAAQLENGNPYGRIVACYNFGAGDIVEIELADGTKEMLPCQKPFILTVQNKEKCVIVMPPDYIEAKEEE